jgi:hypothetical protein
MTNWRKYNGAIVSDSPPHFELNTQDLISKIKEESVLLARWTSDFDSKIKSDFWYIICDKALELNDYSSNTRNQIRKGLKNCTARRVSKEEIIQHGYDVYFSAFNNYKTYLKAKNKQDFIKEIEEKQSDWDFWGVFYNKKIIGYSKNRIVDNYCEYASIKLHPEYLRYYPSYALLYKMNRYYLNENNFRYVNNGARSISHDTNIQEFLMQKFRFRKAYCKLHVLYTPRVRVIVSILYPFRCVFKYLPGSFFKKIADLLSQEKIVKSFE